MGSSRALLTFAILYVHALFMVNATPPSAPEAPDAALLTGAARDCAWMRDMLREMAEAGMELTRAVVRQVRAQGELIDVADRAGVTEIVGGSITLNFRGDPSLAFVRLSRAVRMTMMLELRLTHGDLSPAALAAGLAASLAAATTRSAGEDASQDDDAEAEGFEPEASDREGPERERPERENRERLIDADTDDIILTMPFEAAVTHIRRDLGLARAAVERRDAEPLIQSPPEAWPRPQFDPPPGVAPPARAGLGRRPP
jgi:hypothetical protein